MGDCGGMPGAAGGRSSGANGRGAAGVVGRISGVGTACGELATGNSGGGVGTEPEDRATGGHDSGGGVGTELEDRAATGADTAGETGAA